MSQHSEERVSEQDIQSTKARVIPFERPQSELQKAVQQRAQETLDRERARANQKPPAWRRALVLVLAAVPVVLTFGAAIGFVSALRQFNTAVFESAKREAPTSTQSTAPPAEPGVVLLESYQTKDAPTQNRPAAPVSPQPR